jgi:NADPH-dependent 2,4-dienoyl-CoA reductase/sulfur reductase-like enzyme
MRNIVIIGGGPAGVFAAIEAKRRDGEAEVTLLSEEPCEPYERPPLSKAVLSARRAPPTLRSRAPRASPAMALTSRSIRAAPRSTAPRSTS